jgi:hypothetical protein
VGKIPGVNHLHAIRALEKAGFRVVAYRRPESATNCSSRSWFALTCIRTMTLQPTVVLWSCGAQPPLPMSW